MNYFVDVFSPATYSVFSKTDKSIAGFSTNRLDAAKRLRPGDRLVCYVTKVSRWVGILEVIGEVFQDTTSRLVNEDDPYIVRVNVTPLVWLDITSAVPIREPFIWEKLSFTQGLDQNSHLWTGTLRRSLNRLTTEDGEFLEAELRKQLSSANIVYPIEEAKWNQLVGHPVQTSAGTKLVSVPEMNTDDDISQAGPNELRESIAVQAQLGRIGTQLGMKVWIPQGDRQRVLNAPFGTAIDVIDTLPLNYDETTIKTIERIDVLWLKRNSIVRAFEVEHTTSIYSGILRMADLMALQPNMDINIHIVAPEQRREKVFDEIRRPVFAYLERGPLAENCTYISYSNVRLIASLPHLNRMSSEIIDDYAEEVE